MLQGSPSALADCPIAIVKQGFSFGKGAASRGLFFSHSIFFSSFSWSGSSGFFFTTAERLFDNAIQRRRYANWDRHPLRIFRCLPGGGKLVPELVARVTSPKLGCGANALRKMVQAAGSAAAENESSRMRGRSTSTGCFFRS